MYTTVDGMVISYYYWVDQRVVSRGETAHLPIVFASPVPHLTIRPNSWLPKVTCPAKAAPKPTVAQRGGKKKGSAWICTHDQGDLMLISLAKSICRVLLVFPGHA
jgi:hypothetical protein